MKKFQLLFFILLFLSPVSVFAQPDSPNIVIILADDLGYADVGVYGAPKIRTPTIDNLASEGMKFTQFYAENFCSPSRGALLTGIYAHRVGITRVFWPESDDGLHPEEVTIAELLKDKDYM